MFRCVLQACGRIFTTQRGHRGPLLQPKYSLESTVELYLSDEDWQEILANQRRVIEEVASLGVDEFTARFRADVARGGNWLRIVEVTKAAEAEVARLRSLEFN